MTPPEARAGARWEALEAGRGLGRLFAFNAKWPESFDFSKAGVRRSFYGPLLALPFYVFHIAMVEATQVGRSLTPDVLGAAAGEHLLDAYGYVLLVVLIARPLGVRAGVGAFVTVVNWGALYLNAILGAASLLLMAGSDGVDAFRLIYLLLLIASVMLVWRAGRETLTRELAPILLLVVLSVGWSVAVSQAADWALSRF